MSGNMNRSTTINLDTSLLATSSESVIMNTSVRMHLSISRTEGISMKMGEYDFNRESE